MPRRSTPCAVIMAGLSPPARIAAPKSGRRKQAKTKPSAAANKKKKRTKRASPEHRGAEVGAQKPSEDDAERRDKQEEHETERCIARPSCRAWHDAMETRRDRRLVEQ